MAAITKFDDLFFGILQNCEQIEPFLDVVFSFLARRTDFFCLMHSKTDKMGFPPGVAEKMVLKIFKKYQSLVLKSEEGHSRQTKMNNGESKGKKTKKDEAKNKPKPDPIPSVSEHNPDGETAPISTPSEVPPVDTTIDVQTTNPADSAEQTCAQLSFGETLQKPTESSPETATTSENLNHNSQGAKPATAPECFNGAVLDNYMWSQTGSEVDVRVPVPITVKGKDVLVEIKNNYLKVALKNTQEEGPNFLVDGELQWKIHAEESMWTLIPGEHIHISLDKVEDRWWTCVIKGDKEIDKSKIDTTRDISEFDEQTQCDYERVMYDQRQKMLGKPTSQEMKTHEVLKKAWDAPNSPFAGTPFDPSKVNISGSFS